MVTVFVLDVAEFHPIVECAKARGDCQITRYDKGYIKISAETEIVLSRSEMKMKPAIWYGLFTGGLIGEIKEWDRETVRVIGTNRSL